MALMGATASFGPTPAPPRQSPLQLAVRSAAVANAAALSRQATPALLALVATEEFRRGIAGLRIGTLPAADLLEQYREAVRLAPIVHNLDPAQFLTVPHMLNDWETGVDNSTRTVEEYIERHVFPGFPPFRGNKCLPPACAQRPRYFALNNWGFANGAFAFGHVSMVPRKDYVRNMTVLLPMDTGSYAMCCTNGASNDATNGLTPVPHIDIDSSIDINIGTATPAKPGHAASTAAAVSTAKSLGPVNERGGSGDARGGGVNINCSAWRNFSVGTFEHFDHTTLAGLRAWANPSLSAAQLLATQFNAMFSNAVATPPTVDVGYLMTYTEVMVVGSVAFPDGVSHIVLYFSPLFGTEAGRAACRWARKMGVGVAWSPGELSMSSNTVLLPGRRAASTYPQPSSPQLLLDPTIPFVPNATSTNATQAAFMQVWASVAAAPGGQSEAWWTKQWDAVYTITGAGLHVHNLRPGLCSDAGACIGVDDDARCLCRAAPQSKPI